MVSEVRWPGGSREGGNTGKGTEGKSELRKGEIKRNLRVGRNQARVQLVPLVPRVELVSL